MTHCYCDLDKMAKQNCTRLENLKFNSHIILGLLNVFTLKMNRSLRKGMYSHNNHLQDINRAPKVGTLQYNQKTIKQNRLLS
jgi:hypothetical protein